MIVFVHGVPETAAIWDEVRSHVDGDSVALALPGFGCPRPDDFGATKDDYADWLAAEIAAIDEPVDLVGHDWGAGITYRVATRDGDLLRSWAADVGNIAHPEYRWHDFAQIWQSPGDGEAFFAAQNDTDPAERAPLYEAMGVPADDALAMASAGDETMGQCILSLYRSAMPNPHADWGPWSATTAPGLVLHPADDPFSDAAMAAEVADQLGASFATILGAGHFWPYQAPEEAAAVLNDFWRTLD